jgi:hypothetical protein
MEAKVRILNSIGKIISNIHLNQSKKMLKKKKMRKRKKKGISQFGMPPSF